MHISLKAFLDNCVFFFPISTSIIPLYIIACVMNSDGEQNPLTLKILYKTLSNFSDVGIKNNLRDLISGSFIEIRPSSLDGRVKTINPTQKLNKIYKEFFDSLK
jgi:hypothetical protein